MRRFARVGLTLMVLAAPAWFASAASAGVTTYSLAPASGPGGTNVSVSGSGCSPGIVVSPSLDYVQIAATTVPPATAHIAVAANGTWNGTLVIPANAAAGSAVVTAVCVTNGLQSLLTIYLPNTFTVTAATPTTPVTTAPTTTPTTAPATTPTTADPGDPTSPTTTHAPSTTAGSSSTTPGGPGTSSPGQATGADPNGPLPGNRDGGRGTNAGSPTARSPKGASRATHATDAARAADLDAPELAVADARRAHSGSSGWWWWLLLVAGLAAGAAVLAWRQQSTLMATFGEVSGVDPAAGG